MQVRYGSMAKRRTIFFGSVGVSLTGAVCCWRGEFFEARVHYEDALSLWDPAQGTSVTALAPVDPYVSVVINLFRTLLYLGHIDHHEVTA
jgi:hypothetical protein